MVKIIGDYGFCFGVTSAIETLRKNKDEDKRIILLHPLIHNRLLNDKLMHENNAFLYTDNIKLNTDDRILFSAHGHLKEEEMKYKDYQYFDATCPLIIKRYNILKENYHDDYLYYFLGKKDHQETISFLSQFPYLKLIDVSDVDTSLTIIKKNISKEIKTALIPQTTISFSIYNKVKEFFMEYSNLSLTTGICSLYYKRVTDAISLFKEVNISNSYFIVVGDKMSSNTNEIYKAIKKEFNELNGTISLLFEDLNLKEIEDKDVYLISSTSVSKEEVETLYNKLDVFFKEN